VTARSRTHFGGSLRNFDSITDCRLSLYRTLMNLFSFLSPKYGPGGLFHLWNDGKSLLLVWMLKDEVWFFFFSVFIVMYGGKQFSLTLKWQVGRWVLKTLYTDSSRSIPLCVMTTGTEEYSLAQQYVKKCKAFPLHAYGAQRVLGG
jgi:hypothetical protein